MARDSGQPSPRSRWPLPEGSLGADAGLGQWGYGADSAPVWLALLPGERVRGQTQSSRATHNQKTFILLWKNSLERSTEYLEQTVCCWCFIYKENGPNGLFRILPLCKVHLTWAPWWTGSLPSSRAPPQHANAPHPHPATGSRLSTSLFLGWIFMGCFNHM